MSHVQVGKPRYDKDGDYSVLSAEVAVGAEHHSVWYRTPVPVARGVEPFLVASLFAAMRTGLPLHTEEPVSPLLLSNLQQIQEIFHGWDRTFSIVPVEAPAKRDQVRPASGVGCFFSGGVDSFYSMLKHLGEITSLIFIHGFDIPLNETLCRDRVRESLQTVANHLELPLLEVETNLRSLTVRYLHWGFSHGAALASVALFLSEQLGRVYIPSTYAYADLIPLGSHPLVDRLWSTEQLELIHDGCEATRTEKIASIARHEVALRHLRVCWEYQDGMYNCGKCEKCLRTMIGLRIAGALERCSTFDRPLDCRAVGRIRIKTQGALIHLEENLKALESTECDPRLAKALRDCLNNQASLQVEDERWEQDTALAKSELAQLIPPAASLVLIDEDLLGTDVVGNRKFLPFTERDGAYWGPPADDDGAIAECERLRGAGADFLVIAWPAFWWLEHYKGLKRHLYGRYPCLIKNSRLVVFGLSDASVCNPPSRLLQVAQEV